MTINLNDYLDRLPILAYTMGGDLVIITDKDDDPDYSFNSTYDDSYAEDGRSAHHYDDLAYVLDDVVIPKFNAPLIIRAGRKYKTRDGLVVEILTTEGRDPYSVIGYIDDRPTPLTWTTSGRHYQHEISDTDLVEEI